jgi:UDP-N-acetylmuramate: L-alanyl-gamma-D-glutamyl-meso-diaminopimelate ligase
MRVHLMAVGGTGMGSLAGLLKAQGHEVSGCDKPLYSPMKESIEELKINFMEGHSAKHLELDPEVVVIGNAIHKGNEEAEAFMKKGFKYLSMAEAIHDFSIKDRQSVVVAGTHGKTTTTAILGFIFKEAGFKPNMILGGISKNYMTSYLWGGGDWTVVEGDEYETAFFDKGPKFLHYDPAILLLNNIEMDHLDNFKNEEELIAAFRKLLDILKPGARICGGTESPEVAKILARNKKPFESFGISGSETWSASNIRYRREGTFFRLLYRGKDRGHFSSPLYGAHNLRNVIGAIAASAAAEIPIDTIREIMPYFQGVKRRQEVVIQKNGITVVDDFAHHPTALYETIKGLRQRFNPTRVIACWEPRSYTCQTKLHQGKMPHAFLYANTVLLGPFPQGSKIPEDDRLNLDDIASALRLLGKEVLVCQRESDYIDYLKKTVREGDMVGFFSSGSFYDLPAKLAELIK